MQGVASVDADDAGPTHAPDEHDPDGHELPERRMDRPEGLACGQGQLPRRELTLGLADEQSEDPYLGPRAEDLLEHRTGMTVQLYRFFDYMYGF
jgi:hypothetical protein